jgi:hypothetical protein
MILPRPENETTVSVIKELPLAHFSISVLTGGRNQDELCVGTEDGKVVFITGSDESPLELEASGEAVDGIAFVGKHVAITDRAHIRLATTVGKAAVSRRLIIPCGAHGVTTTADGAFVAPLGIRGFLRLAPSEQREQIATLHKPEGQALYFYSPLSLQTPDRNPLVFAARRGGVVSFENNVFRSISAKDMDIVDLCPLGRVDEPFGFAAVAIDGAIWLHDVDAHADGLSKPVVLRFEEIRGTAYRVFSCLGSIIVLTSTGLYHLNGLADRFENGRLTNNSVLRMRSITGLEAFDANLWNRQLLVALADGAVAIDLEQLGDRLKVEECDSEHNVTPALHAQSWQTHTATVTTTTISG